MHNEIVEVPALGPFQGRIALSPQEVCRALGIGRTHLYELIKTGSLETVKLGSRRLITRDAINRLLVANKAAP